MFDLFFLAWLEKDDTGQLIGFAVCVMTNEDIYWKYWKTKCFPIIEKNKKKLTNENINFVPEQNFLIDWHVPKISVVLVKMLLCHKTLQYLVV